MKRLSMFFLVALLLTLSAFAAAYELESATISGDTVNVRVSAEADCTLSVALCYQYV